MGAFLGTIIGIVIQVFSAATDSGAEVGGLFGTSVTAGDLVLPFTAGTLLRALSDGRRFHVYRYCRCHSRITRNTRHSD
jgi:hypothetical protein